MVVKGQTWIAHFRSGYPHGACRCLRCPDFGRHITRRCRGDTSAYRPFLPLTQANGWSRCQRRQMPISAFRDSNALQRLTRRMSGTGKHPSKTGHARLEPGPVQLQSQVAVTGVGEQSAQSSFLVWSLGQLQCRDRGQSRHRDLLQVRTKCSHCPMAGIGIPVLVRNPASMRLRQ